MSLNTNKNPVFNWSPLPQRKYLTQKHNYSNSGKNNDVLFPNCDNLLWLRSCDQEVVDPLHGNTSGKIPEWLNGTLIRNGPGSFKVGNHTYEHLFDSAALLHRFHIKNGIVTYQCRFLQSDVYKRNMAAQRIVFTEFGTKATPDPCQTIFHRIRSIFTKENTSDNATITVYPFGDELYAFPETPIIHRINKNDLSTEEKVCINDHIAIVHHTSHPHVMNDGTVYNLAMSIGILGPTHRIVCFPNEKNNDTKKSSFFNRANFVAEVPARWRFHPSYMHSFGITENYFIIVEQPLTLSTVDLAKCKQQNEPLIGAFNWFHEEKTKFNILSRKTGELLQCFLADSFFYLHIINQYEIDDYVVIDICCYRDPTMLECMYVEALKNLHKNPNYAKMFRSRPLRFALPLKTNLQNAAAGENIISLNNCKAKAYFQKNGELFVVPERLCELGCEVPRINYDKYLGRFYQYFYAISADVDAKNPGTMIKVDVLNKTTMTWCEENCYPSEPIFVPAPNSQCEDDGILLSAILWGNNDTNRVGLLILNAKTMKEIGRAEFKTPGIIPKCLHGWFISDKS